MRGTIIHLDGTTRKTHVLEVGEQFATTSFGTFRLGPTGWRWICDERFELRVVGRPFTSQMNTQLITP